MITVARRVGPDLVYDMYNLYLLIFTHTVDNTLVARIVTQGSRQLQTNLLCLGCIVHHQESQMALVTPNGDTTFPHRTLT
jgi:hypothetical protein